MRVLPLFVLLLPMIELLVMIAFASRFGFSRTLLEILGTGIWGAVLLQQFGMPAVQNANQQLQTGEMPAAEIMGGLLRSVGGFLLFLPGLVTDFVGLMLVIPATRRRIITRWVRNADVFQFNMHTQYRSGGFQPPPRPGSTQQQPPPRASQHRPDVIEGEFHRDD